MAELEQLPESESESDTGSRRMLRDLQPLPEDLFPLPLTPFEHYLVIDDVPEQPMTAFIQINFRDSIDRERMEAAMVQALQRHPLLASRIIPYKQSWAWHHDPEWRPILRPMHLQGPCVDGQVLPLNLRHEPGIRGWYDDCQNDAERGGSRLILQFHHACADGMGFRRFVVSLLTCYARMCLASDDPIHRSAKLDRFDQARLTSRGCLLHIEKEPPARRLTSWERTKNFIYFFFRPPVPLSGSVGSFASREESSEPLQTLRLDNQESAAILERARSQEIRINDLALAALFHVCRQWHEMHDTRGGGKRIRLLMPFDIRTKEDLHLSAANRMSFSFLGRTHRQCEDWDDLLRSVQAETRAIKDTRVYADFLFGLRSGMTQPGLLRWIVRRCRNMATLVFTYSGDLQRGLGHLFVEEEGCTRVGDKLLEDVLGAPPVRRNTNIAIGMCLGNGRICISATWNRRVLTGGDTRYFLQMFADALRSWARDGKPDSQSSARREG